MNVPFWYAALHSAGVEYPYFAVAKAALMADQLDLIGRALRAESAT